ncbi:MAG TPA: GNAT family N-acetyltransferase [Actinomycetes bacterium]|jgi:GNAT superfamily N-acetyltransferase|nr:GNAT family N-acetyltransferase [Actinomycetes bacterium]
MLAPVANETAVLAVLADRYRLPMEKLAPGRVAVTEVAHPGLPVRAFSRLGGAVVAVTPGHAAQLRELLDGPASLEPALRRMAAAIPGHLFSGVARTGVAIPPPAVEVTVIDTTDPRLPDWVLGHFTGEAWVVLGDHGEVLSSAVLKRYDDRLREISVGTAEQARGRGLARAVVAAAARAVLAEGRVVLYNHAPDNHASARVAESVGLHELGRYHAIVPDRRLAAEFGEDDTVETGEAPGARGAEPGDRPARRI